MTSGKTRNIYLVGIKGVGMAALAVYLKERGKNVWGSDVVEEFPTDAILHQNNIKMLKGFHESNIDDDIDLVITTGAHGGLENVEVKTARNKNIPVMTLAQEVGHLMNEYKTRISVCGSHGKTTTSAMIAFVLNKLGLNASHLVGVPKFSGLNGGHYGGTDHLTVEADEYVASPGIDDTPRFMYQSPNIIICTNVDYDHPDVFPTQESMEEVYLNFFRKLDKENGVLIYCEEDERLVKLVAQLDIKNKHRYSLIKDNQIDLAIPGRHNQLNACAVQALADVLKFDTHVVKRHLMSFSGSSRRFEKIFETNDTYLYDDYAHHPREIEATIEAVRGLYPQRRLLIIFQSHTYSRTKQFLREFVSVLGKADEAIVTDVFSSAREKEISVRGVDFENEAHNQGINNLSYISYE